MASIAKSKNNGFQPTKTNDFLLYVFINPRYTPIKLTCFPYSKKWSPSSWIFAHRWIWWNQRSCWLVVLIRLRQALEVACYLGKYKYDILGSLKVNWVLMQSIHVIFCFFFSIWVLTKKDGKNYQDEYLIQLSCSKFNINQWKNLREKLKKYEIMNWLKDTDL